jgi:Lar family restriction alleviation protein
MSEHDMKPCPFCGEKTPYTDEASCRIFGNRTGHNFAVACSACEVSAPGNGTMEGAIAEWNTRALPAKLDKAMEGLRSIAANTCCTPCQEAALVARAIIAEIEGSDAP